MIIATWTDDNGERTWQELRSNAAIEWHKARGATIVYVSI